MVSVRQGELKKETLNEKASFIHKEAQRGDVHVQLLGTGASCFNN